MYVSLSESILAGIRARPHPRFCTSAGSASRYGFTISVVPVRHCGAEYPRAKWILDVMERNRDFWGAEITG